MLRDPFQKGNVSGEPAEALVKVVRFCVATSNADTSQLPREGPAGFQVVREAPLPGTYSTRQVIYFSRAALGKKDQLAKGCAPLLFPIPEP